VRICLLTHQDLDADDFPEDDWPCDPRPFLPEHEWHVAPLYDKWTSVKHVEAMIREGFDLYFNLCDGPSSETYPGIEVVRTLEKHNVPFTGPTSAFFDPTRLQMKKACRRLGIATPRFIVARKEEDWRKAIEKLSFPIIVKCYNSYASIDLSRHSRVRSEAGLRRQLRKILSRHSAALIEEFIEGVECTVLVAENPDDPQRPTTYTPVQYDFPEGETFKHERLKWIDDTGTVAFPVPDPELSARLRDESARFFMALGGASFGRCDIRVAKDGTPYMLEMNPNCGVYFEEEDYGGADLCLSFDPAGHTGFTRQLVEAAFARHG
jgi:D-alanine-D-alanine ligase-like ATP-grasp enzyme